MKYLKIILATVLALLLVTTGFTATASAQGPVEHHFHFPPRPPHFFPRFPFPRRSLDSHRPEDLPQYFRLGSLPHATVL